MRRRTTIWLAMAVALLASVLYILDHHPTTQQEALLASTRVFDITTEPVTLMGLVRNGDERIEMVRKDDQWFLQSPIRARASHLVMHRLVATAERLRSLDSITAEQRALRNLSLADYGLAPPAGSFYLEAGGRREKVSIGSRTPFGSGVYGLRHDADMVIVLPEEALSLIELRLDDLRDRSLFGGLQRRVNRVDIYRQDLGFLQLIQRGGRWQMQQPMVWPADSGAVQQLLDALYVMQIQRFVWDAPAESENGLQSPAFRSQVEDARLAPDQSHARIAVWVEGSDTGEELFLGSEYEGGGQLYARRWGVPSVFTVPALLGEIASQPVNHFRERRVLLPGWEQLSVLSLAYQDSRLVLRRTSGGNWALEEPVRESQMVRTDAVDALVRALMQLRIASFDPVDVDPADLFSVEASFSGEVPEHIMHRSVYLMRAAGEDSEKSWFGRIGQEGPFLRMTGFDVELSLRDLLHPARFRSHQIISIDPGAVTWIQQSTVHGDVMLRYVQDDEGQSSWQLEHNGEHELDRAALRLFLTSLRDLRAAEVVAFEPDSLALYGLHSPVATISLRFSDPALLQQSILLGIGAEDEAIYARLQGHGYIFRLKDEDASILKMHLLRPLLKPVAEPPDLSPEHVAVEGEAEEDGAIPVLPLRDAD